MYNIHNSDENVLMRRYFENIKQNGQYYTNILHIVRRYDIKTNVK